MIKSYEELIDTHVGDIAFVIGAGPSLNEQSSLKNFNKMFDHVVISVNAGILLCPWQGSPNDGKRFWISNDASVKHWTFWQKIQQSKATKVVRNSWEKYIKEIPDFYFFPPRPRKEDEIYLEDKGLAYCSTVPSAVDLAIQMGCKTIFLLGVDHCLLGGNNYFWQFWPYLKQPRGPITPAVVQNNIYDINMSVFRSLDKFALLVGAKIFNCSPISKVNAFDKVDLEEILEYGLL